MKDTLSVNTSILQWKLDRMKNCQNTVREKLLPGSILTVWICYLGFYPIPKKKFNFLQDVILSKSEGG